MHVVPVFARAKRESGVNPSCPAAVYENDRRHDALCFGMGSDG